MSEKPRVVGVTSGALGLSGLAFIQPYVVAGTIVFLGLGFWFVHRRLRAAAVCDVAQQRRLRWLVWSAATLVFVIDAASFIPRFLI